MNWINQCQDLWGERWKSTLALTAGVKKRQVFRWYGNQHKIPERIVNRIKATWEIWKNNNQL